MAQRLSKRSHRERAHKRARRKISGSDERPRLAVFKSLKYVYAQVIDDAAGETVAQASSVEPEIRSRIKGSAKSREAARIVGELVAERAKEKGIRRVVFDRGGYIYHGRVKELAEGARAKGLEF